MCSTVMVYSHLTTMLGSNCEMFGCENQFLLNTLMSSMKSGGGPSLRCGNSQTDFKSEPNVKTQLVSVGDRDAQATELLNKSAGRKTTGYFFIFCICYHSL